MNSTFVVHSNFEHFKPRLVEVLADFNEIGEFVTKGERNVIKKVKVEDDNLNFKKFRNPNIFQALVYQFLRKSKARRSYEYALKLIDSGIKTPLPIGYSEVFSVGLKESYYISEQLDYDFDFRTLIHQPKFPKRKQILKQFTEFCFTLHENNVNFLDHSPGNTLIKGNDDGSYRFYLIDLNRMKFEPMSLDKRMHNLRRLWLSKTMIKIMSAAYADLYGSSYEETHLLLTKHSRAFQKKINSKKLRKRKK